MNYLNDVLPELKEMSSDALIRMACNLHSKAQDFESKGLTRIAAEARNVCMDIEEILEKRKKAA